LTNNRISDSERLPCECIGFPERRAKQRPLGISFEIDALDGVRARYGPLLGHVLEFVQNQAIPEALVFLITVSPFFLMVTLAPRFF
jgi:hypothetical protein